jgi:hypothetical protein
VRRPLVQTVYGDRTEQAYKLIAEYGPSVWTRRPASNRWTIYSETLPSSRKEEQPYVSLCHYRQNTWGVTWIIKRVRRSSIRGMIHANYTQGDLVLLNPLNAELKPIRHLLALVGARHIVHVSRVRVNKCRTQ